jgi:eukaryotic-like serine/threonine-protein kinase
VTNDDDDDHDDASWLREAAKTTSVAAAEDLSGDTLGRYRLVRVIGRGGMGVVYLARDEKLERDVALKVLPVDALGDERRRRRFLREARIAAKVVDPFIATVFDAGEEGERVFLAMEYVEGRTLRAELRERGKLAIVDAVRIASDIARALVTAHEAGVIHRDVKPDNVMLATDGGVKVLDFGVAKAHDDERPATAEESSLATRAGTLVGTPAYMSPEQAKGTIVDARSDLFSLGVVLYELVVGSRPFDGKTPLDVLIAIDRDEPAPLSRARSEAPRWLDVLVRRCLAKDPAQRPANVREVLDALEAGATARRPAPSKILTAVAGLSAITAAVVWMASARVEPHGTRPATPIASIVASAAASVVASSSASSGPSIALPSDPSIAATRAASAAPHAFPPKSKVVSKSSATPAPLRPGPLDEPK